jgi:PAS domain S-box-containing protein
MQAQTIQPVTVVPNDLFVVPELSTWLMRNAIASTRNGVVVTNATRPDNPIIFCNDAFYQMTGYSPQDIVGRNCRFLQKSAGVDDNCNGAALDELRQAVKLKRGCRVLLRNYRKDGTAFWNELSVSPVKNAEGVVTHFIGVQDDKTAHVEAEQRLIQEHALLEERVAERTMEVRALNSELRRQMELTLRANEDLLETREQFKSIFDNAVEGIYQSTPGGSYIRVNPALAQMYGYDSPEDLMSTIGNIAEQVYVDSVARQGFLALMREKKAVRGLEYEVKRKDGSRIWVCEHARCILDHAGVVKYYEGIIQDITARKAAEAEKNKLENQLRQAQKMEAIGTLAGGIAHDFNNMLTSIIGFTGLSISDKTEPKIRENLQRVLKASQRAADLVRQILSFSRQSESQKKPVSVIAMVREVSKLLRGSLPSTIELRLDVETAQADQVLGDAVQFHQILMNLATNAAYAMRGRHGQLCFGVTTLSLRAGEDGLPAGDYVQIVVSDTGPGIPPEILPRLFEPFFTTKPNGEGTGLGLSVVREIVHAHKGFVDLQSKLDEGTSFRILLPVCRGPSFEDEDLRKVAMRGTERVVVVDDEESVAFLLQQSLTTLGYKVLSFKNSKDALTHILAYPESVDLLITDQTMPLLTGLELTKQVHQHIPKLPVLICSGYADTELRDSAASVGAHFVAKPISLQEISVIMREALAEAG